VTHFYDENENRTVYSVHFKHTDPHMIQPWRVDFVKGRWIHQLTINGIESPERCCYKLL